MKKFINLALLFLCSCHGTNVPIEQSSEPSQARENQRLPKRSEYNYLLTTNNNKILFLNDVEGTTESGAHNFGNEYDPYLFMPIFKKENTNDFLICVGGIRCFIDYGMGKFKNAVFIDIDKNVADFNKSILGLIWDISNTSNMTPLEARVNFISKLILERYEKENQDVSTIIKQCPASNKACKYFQELQENKPDKFKEYFWLDDDQWRHISEGALQQKIAIINGSIADGLAMQSIIKAIKENYWASVFFDQSNVFPHFLGLNQFLPVVEKLIEASKAFYLLFTGFHEFNEVTKLGMGERSPFNYYGEKFLKKDLPKLRTFK